jgi:predicted transcriptional regulator
MSEIDDLKERLNCAEQHIETLHKEVSELIEVLHGMAEAIGSKIIVSVGELKQ